MRGVRVPGAWGGESVRCCVVVRCPVPFLATRSLPAASRAGQLRIALLLRQPRIDAPRNPPPAARMPGRRPWPGCRTGTTTWRRRTRGDWWWPTRRRPCPREPRRARGGGGGGQSCCCQTCPLADVPPLAAILLHTNAKSLERAAHLDVLASGGGRGEPPARGGPPRRAGARGSHDGAGKAQRAATERRGHARARGRCAREDAQAIGDRPGWHVAAGRPARPSPVSAVSASNRAEPAATRLPSPPSAPLSPSWAWPRDRRCPWPGMGWAFVLLYLYQQYSDSVQLGAL